MTFQASPRHRPSCSVKRALQTNSWHMHTGVRQKQMWHRSKNKLRWRGGWKAAGNDNEQWVRSMWANIFQSQNWKQSDNNKRCQVHWVWTPPTAPVRFHHPLYKYCTVSSLFLAKREPSEAWDPLTGPQAICGQGTKSTFHHRNSFLLYLLSLLARWLHLSKRSP